MKENKRRYRMLIVEQQTILAILNGEITLVDFDLPDDARVIGIREDYTRDALAIGIESAQFDPVPLGELLPLLPPFAFRRT